MKQRDELFSNAEHEAEPATTFTESGGDDVLQRDRGGHANLLFGVAGCALAAAAHRRSKVQRERREAERDGGMLRSTSATCLLCVGDLPAREATAWCRNCEVPDHAHVRRDEISLLAGKHIHFLPQDMFEFFC